MSMRKQLLFIRFFTLMLATIGFTPLYAQLSEGGSPPSFSFKASSLRQTIPQYKATINFDVAKMKAEDAKNEASGTPLRAIEIIPADLNMENSGAWAILSNGQRVWRLTINAPGALATMLYYNEFYIPEGGKLFIYNPEHTQILGAYTSRTNPLKAEFATELVAGEQLILEYVEPSKNDFSASAPVRQDNASYAESNKFSTFSLDETQSTDQPRISISGIGYGYNYIQVWNKGGNVLKADGNFNQSGSCMVNINCSEGDDWQHQKRGVARTVTQIGTGGYLCSGTMVNNTDGNLDALYLTAHHCFKDDMNQGTAIFNTMIFYFNWEQPGCTRTTIEPTDIKTWTGAQLLVDLDISGGSDGVLLRLINGNSIPGDYNIFYNGWDRRNTPVPQSGVGIHHPKGDVKKISTYSAPATSASWNSRLSDNSLIYGATNAHWNVTFVATANGYAVTEKGSSGSPLFNQDKRVVGTLSGGNSSCTAPTGLNLYGKLWYHWDQGSTNPLNQMKTYLDPNNTGAEFIDGKYAAGDIVANFSASKVDLYASESLTYTDLSYKATSWNWTFSGGTPASYVGKTPPTIVYNTPGDFEAKLVINQGTADEKEKTVAIKVKQKQNSCPEVKEIGTGTSKAQFPLGISTRQTFSSSIYTAAELGSVNGTISEISWNASNPTALARTIYIYLKEVNETELTAGTWANEISTATLVYQSTAYWMNDAGWNTVKLTTPFVHDGTKNLKVIVRSTAASAGTISSDCYYTTTSNAHMEWTSTTATVPTAAGVVSSNRPNIKITLNKDCGAAAPVADFTAGLENILLKENFDVVMPPSGWTVEKPGASARAWQLANLTNYNFNTINPASQVSAFVQFDNAAMVDTWLKTPKVSITNATTKLEFYALWEGSKFANAQMNVLISTDNGATWSTPIWTTGNTNNTMGWMWRKQTIDLSAYNGQTIQIGWQYRGQGGNYMAIDDVKMFSPNTDGKVTIYEGEQVSFTDLSSGPPVSWNWTLPNGIPATSTLQNPKATYMTLGVHDATLSVANNFGNDTKTVTGAVTVLAKTPNVAFASYSNGFIMQANGGQFLPLTGGPVSFEDKSGNFPRSWSWTMPGATPAASTNQNVDVDYSAGENSYAVTLEATNPANTATLTVPDYVKVGGKAEVWNVSYGESPTTRYASGGYGVTGADIFPQTAERFVAPAEGEISKVRVYTQNVTAGSAQMTVAIYSDNDGLPGVALSPVMTINGASIVNGGYNTITFPNPISISGAFHVVVGSTNYNSTYFTVPTVSSRASEYGTVSAYTTDWAPLSTRFSGLYVSMNIIPEFKYTVTTMTLPIATFKKKNIDSSVGTVTMDIQTTATGLWTATASSSWIHLSTPSGPLSQTSFTFTCDENLGDLRNGYIAVSIGGITKYAIVHQAGVAPANLTATYNSTDQTADLAWTHKGVQEGDIFDDAESHTSFTINSAGTTGWSYIDGDGSTTYSINGVSYPGSGSAMAFVVFDPSQTTPAATALNTQPHSGNKYFACFAATTPSNNDWMVSPLLNFPSNFKFSFWAKSATNQYSGGERIRVVYSTTGNAQADFTNVLTTAPYAVVPQAAWTRYEFTVPANAKHVAINCVTNDEFLLMIDDIFIGTGMAPLSSPAINSTASLSSGPDLLKEMPSTTNSTPSQMAAVTPVKANKWGLESTSENVQMNMTYNQLYSAPVDTKLRWDNAVYYNAIGVASGADIEVAILFDQKDLYKYHGTKIKAVEIFPLNLGNNMVLNIRKGGVIIHSQPLTGLTANTFNQIVLTTPITLDATETLTAGYAYTQLPGLYVASCGVGPAKKGKGDLISLNGSPFEALSDISALNVNWNIAVVLEDNSGSNSDITFNVYRDNVLVTSGLTPKAYKNPITLGDNACYTVTAVHNSDSELETTYSNEACLDAKSEITIQALDITVNQYATIPAFNFTVTGNLMGLFTEAQVRQWVTTSCSGNSSSMAGQYPIVVSAQNGDPDHFVVKTINGTLTIVGRTATRILDQPVGGVVCVGSDFTMTVRAEGENLSYQWYKGNNLIQGNNRNTLELKNVSSSDYDNYSVRVKGETGTVVSNSVTLYVANRLESLSFKEFPEIAYTGIAYAVKLNGYSGVSKYTWSFSKDGAAVFAPESGSKNETTVTFNPAAFGVGTINVNMEHPCGPYSLSKDVNVKYPTGIDDIDNPTVKIYPNPVTTVLNISYNQQIIKSVIVNDVSGRTIERHNNVDSNLLTIQTSKWNKGTYVVIIETNTGTTVSKVIKK